MTSCAPADFPPNTHETRLNLMSDPGHNGGGAVPPHVQLIQMATAYWVSRIVYVAAQLKLADHLASGSKTAAEPAEPTGTHA